MIRGYFSREGARQRAFVNAAFQFSAIDDREFETPLLVDTGADRTILSPGAARRLALRFTLDLATLPRGVPSTGVGGQANTRIVDTVLNLQGFSTPLTLTVLEAPPGPLPPIPSLLGRDVLIHFALFMEQRTNRVFLLDPSEADRLSLPPGREEDDPGRA